VFSEEDAEAEIEARASARLARKRIEHRSSLDVGRDDWETPEPIMERVRMIAPIELDPCTSGSNQTGAARFLTKADDGLKRDWSCDGLAFVNFPYSRARDWAVKTVIESRRCGHVVALPAARPGARFYRTLQEHCRLYVELEGRVKFVGATYAAPFPTAAFYFGPEPDAFVAAFEDIGIVLVEHR